MTDSKVFQKYGQKNSLYDDICFKHDMKNGFTNPPFELFMNPLKFYCAQIPGIDPNETAIIDNSLDNPIIFAKLIEIVTFQRKYEKRFSYIQPILIGSTQLPKYTIFFKNSLISSYQTVCNSHSQLSKQLGIIINSRPDKDKKIVSEFVEVIIKQAEMLVNMQIFHELVIQNEDVVFDFSLEYTSNISTKIDGETITQVIHSSKSWMQHLLSSVKSLANEIPQGRPERQKLNQFSSLLPYILQKLK